MDKRVLVFVFFAIPASRKLQIDWLGTCTGSLSNELVEPLNGELMPALESFFILMSLWISEWSWSWAWDRNCEECIFPFAHAGGAGWDHSLVKYQVQRWAAWMRLPILPRKQTSKGGCWLEHKYSQPSISYRICFSNYLYFSLVTQHEAKWLLAKIQVAERSRAFRHVSSTCWCVTSWWAFFDYPSCFFQRTQRIGIINKGRTRNGFPIL